MKIASPFTKELGAHIEAAEMIFQIVGEDAQEFVLVLGKFLEPITGGFEGELRANAGNQFGLVKRLGNIINAPGVKGTDDKVFVISSGKENDGNVAPLRIFLYFQTNVPAAHSRHQEIQ